MRNSSLSLISWCAGQVWGLCVWWFVVCRSLSLIWRARVARVVPPAVGLGHCSGCEAFLRCTPCVCVGETLRKVVGGDLVSWCRVRLCTSTRSKTRWESQGRVGGCRPAGVSWADMSRQAQWRRWAHWARHARRCCCTPVAGNRWRRWVAAPTCHHLVGGTNLPPPCQTIDHGQLMSCASVVTSKGFQAFSMHWRK